MTACFQSALELGSEQLLWGSSLRRAWLIPSSIRYWIGMLREDHLTEAIRTKLSTSCVSNFSLVSLEPQLKEGGLFVRYRYQDFDDESTTANVIEEQLRTSLAARGGIPSWANLDRSEVWTVKGIPWREVWAFCTRDEVCADYHVLRTCNDLQPRSLKSRSKVRTSQKNKFGNFLGYAIVCLRSVVLKIIRCSHLALWSNI